MHENSEWYSEKSMICSVSVYAGDLLSGDLARIGNGWDMNRYPTFRPIRSSPLVIAFCIRSREGPAGKSSIRWAASS